MRGFLFVAREYVSFAGEMCRESRFIQTGLVVLAGLVFAMVMGWL